jgi:hypothetical protein
MTDSTESLLARADARVPVEKLAMTSEEPS